MHWDWATFGIGLVVGAFLAIGGLWGYVLIDTFRNMT